MFTFSNLDDLTLNEGLIISPWVSCVLTEISHMLLLFKIKNDAIIALAKHCRQTLEDIADVTTMYKVFKEQTSWF